MATQGLVVRYYPRIKAQYYVELNQCLWNHMGVGVNHKEKCHNGMEIHKYYMKMSVEEIWNMCDIVFREQWLCQAAGVPKGRKQVGKGRRH